MTTGAIIQARMGSTRLPGKVLKAVNDHTLLTYLVKRIRRSDHLDKIVVATSDRSENDVIEEECREHGIECYRGKEEDLLDRYVRAAAEYDMDRIVRITADCPLVDPQVIDQMIGAFSEDVDYLTNNRPRTYPHGLDAGIIKQDALREVWRSTEPQEGRHVIKHLVAHSTFNNENRFQAKNISHEVDFSHVRITVDYPEDLEVVRFLISNTSIEAPWQEYIAALTEHPEYIEKNRHHRQH
jgi:spore coat polysaccharide biosynthesis protein SpsF